MRGGIEKPPDSPTWRPHRALLVLRLPPPSWRRLLGSPPSLSPSSWHGVKKGGAGRAGEGTGAAAPSQRRPPARSNAIITPALRMRGERGTAPRLHLPPPSSGQRGSLPKPRYFLPLPTRGGAGGLPRQVGPAAPVRGLKERRLPPPPPENEWLFPQQAARASQPGGGPGAAALLPQEEWGRRATALPSSSPFLPCGLLCPLSGSRCCPTYGFRSKKGGRPQGKDAKRASCIGRYLRG